MFNEDRSEAEYRQLPVDSSSSLKDFSTDRRKYRKRYILKEKVNEKENLAANMGRIVETLLLERDKFDERFYMSSLIAAPTGLMLLFVEALYRLSKASTNSEGIVAADFTDLTEQAYVESGYKIPYEKVIAKFIGSDAELYYEEIRLIRSRGLTVVTSQDVSNAEKIVEELRTNFVTKRIVNLEPSKRFQILDQLQIDNFTIDGLPMKGMLDKVIVDHKLKTIHPYDLKCVWSVEGFFSDYYLYRRAYIQAFVYYYALSSLTVNKDSPFYNYEVKFLKFMICDSINYFNPLIYTLNDVDMEEAYFGFTHRGRHYPGVQHIISELKWAKENDIWNISKSNFDSQGVVNIKGNDGLDSETY